MSGGIRWSLGAQTQGEGGYEFSPSRSLTEDEVAQLQKDFEFLGALAKQGEFDRLLHSAQSWGDLIDRAVEEGAEEGEISEATQRSARREIRAFARLANDFIGAAKVRIAKGEEATSRAAMLAVSAFYEAKTYVELGHLARCAEEGRDLLQVDPHGNLVLSGTSGTETPELPVAVIGFASTVIPHVLKTSLPWFRAVAAGIRSMADEVAEGTPGLIGVEADPDTGEAKNLKLQSLPLGDVAVLEAAYEQKTTEDAISVILQNRDRSTVNFGETSADRAIRNARASEGMDALPEATFDLLHDLLGGEPVDFWAPVTFTARDGHFERKMFAGVVQSAELDEIATKLKCEGAAALTEHTTGGMLSANIPPAELVHSLIAQSGWEGELILSEEPGEATEEEFEVLVPLQGVSVESVVSIGAAELLSAGDGRRIFDALAIKREGETFFDLRTAFFDASAYIRAIVETKTPHEAEDLGAVRIETALAWITTRGRYGTALMPDGSGQSFDRQLALRTPERGPVILVNGRTTHRQWLRWPHGSQLPVDRKIEADTPTLEPALPEYVPIAVRQALLALQLASTQRDTYAQSISIWQSIESFAAKTKCRRLFSKDEMKELRELIPARLHSEQSQVLDRAIGNLNEPPVRERMLQRIKRDGIPLAEHELKLLDRLRRARNDAVHGRELNQPPTREEVNYGIGIVARMLVHRVADLEPGSAPGGGD